MKIALITGEYPPYVRGGVGHSSYLLVRQLRKKGIIVDVYVYSGRSHEPIFSESGTTRYYAFSAGNFWPVIDLYAFMKLRSKVNHYDLVHAYWGREALGFLKKINPSIKTVATLAGVGLACLNYRKWVRSPCEECSSHDLLHCAFERKKWIENKFFKFFVPAPVLFTYFDMRRWCAQRLDKYFALSQTMKEMHVAAGFLEKKIEVIPNMYDPEFFEKLERINVKKRVDKIVILYVGRLSEEKGVEDLIRAFSKMSLNNVELHITGSGPKREELENIANATEMKKQIKFLGWTNYDVLPIIYKSADIFVHPARWPEAFGRTILEAMLAKLAIITSSSGAPRHILGDSGVIYETGNVAELTGKLEMLIENKEIRVSLGARAYDKATEHYDPDTVTSQIIRNYEELIK